MIGRKSFPFLVVLALLDGLATGLAAAAAYRLRFAPWFPIEVTKGVPEFSAYLRALPVVVMLALLSNRVCRLYHAGELGSLVQEGWAVVKSSLLTGVLLAAASFFYRGYEYSRLTLLLFVATNVPFLLGMRIAVRALLHRSRLGEGMRRNCLIVGTGRQAQVIHHRLTTGPYPVYRPVAFLDLQGSAPRRQLRGLPVYASTEDPAPILRRHHIDLVVAAAPYRQYEELQRFLNRLTKETVDVVLSPDDFGLYVLRSRAFEFQGLPMISLLDTPLSGPNRFVKRAMDIALSAFLLVALSPLFLILILLVKLTSRGPIFYRQERMGLDGRLFRIIKFRTMHHDAEARTGPRWATPDDARRTPFGVLLRRTSLDELPQLLNVLVGDMSLVGPRPERPVFIEQFRRTMPNYMLRHRIRAGLTGWAQVHGWRGNTSLRKRLQYDLYYIRNWSLGLDLRILVMTLFRGFVNRNAY